MVTKILLTALLWCAVNAVAQPGNGSALAGDRQLDRQQLRGELRFAAQPLRVSDAAANEGSPGAALTGDSPRRLTPRERAEMRQQLRQGQIDNPRIHP